LFDLKAKDIEGIVSVRGVKTTVHHKTTKNYFFFLGLAEKYQPSNYAHTP
jgi:hypothetical protein